MVLPTDNLVISQDTTFSPGTYFLPSGIKIQGNNISLDGNGAILIGENCNGIGITATKEHNITIKNITLQGYFHGIRIENTINLTIKNCIISHTNELPANTSFLDIWLPADKAYGAGVLLNQVLEATIEANDLSHQMAGVLAYRCENLTVKKNLANYCSAWGFYINETCNSLFEDNSADFCCRYEPRGMRRGHMGADAAGFLILNSSRQNKFLRNNARMGGDGFFLAGMNPQFELVGCDNNFFEENDGSYSPNNAFEATFSSGNIFRANYADFSNYGFWLGFSRDGTLENNQINGNRQAGIAAEKGIHFNVRNNLISNNRHGILLWSKHLPDLEKSLPENQTSLDWQIENNQLISNHKAIRIAADQDHGVRPLPEDGELGFSAPKPQDHRIRYNKFRDNIYVIEKVEAINTLIHQNELLNNLYV